MFWRKKQQPGDETEAAPPKKHPIRRVLAFFFRALKYCCLLLLFCAIAIFGAIYWCAQTQSGQAWLLKTANSALSPFPPADGLSFQLTSLTGSIPANFQFGIEAADKHGVWLKAPQNSFSWNWRELPGIVHINKVIAENVDISRLPDLPQSPPEPPAKPLTIADIQRLLAQGADFLSQKHWWLPAIRIDQIALSNALLPQNLLPAPDKSPQRLAISANANAAFVDNQAHVELRASAKNALDPNLSLPSSKIDGLAATLRLDAGPAPGGLRAEASLQTSVGKPLLDLAAIPADFLGQETKLKLALAAHASTGQDNPGIAIELTGPNLNAGHLNITGQGQWRTNASWRDGQIAGPLAYKLNLALDPVHTEASPLFALKTPAKAALALNGDLPKLNASLNLDCAQISQNGHEITNASLAMVAKDVELPLNVIDLHALEKENRIHLGLNAFVDRRKVSLGTELFFQALAQASPADAKGWRAGLRNLTLHALGLDGAGSLAVLLPAGQKPGIDGAFNINVQNWQCIAAFLPGQTLSGQARLEAALDSGVVSHLPYPPARGASLAVPARLALQQRAHVKLDIPAFAMRSKDSSVELDGFLANIGLDNVFAAPAINADVHAGKIAVAGMELAANVKASGPVLTGPLKVQANAKGAVNAQIAAQWQPGKAEVDSLQVVADIGRFIQPRKKFLAGIRSSQKTQITYGDHGVQVSNIDLRLLPGGRIQANGGLSPEKLDLKLVFDDFQLKPLQALAPAMPSGTVSLNASLNGSPQRPAGQFRINLKDITVPQNPLKPVSLALAGKLEHGGGNSSALKTQLEIDPATIKALGGNAAQITASLPLLFGPNGVPKPDMSGPLAAKIKWDGSLGPLWNLLPVPDQRVNGRLGIDLTAAGSLDKPKIAGTVNINKGRYENILFGVLLTDINLRLALADAGKSAIAGLPGGMKLNLGISDGRGGSLTAQGQGALDGSSLDIKAKINNLKPLRRRDVHIELGGHAEVTGSATNPDISGEIIVNKGEILLDNLEVTGSVTTLPITDPKEPAKAAAEKAKAQKKSAKTSKAAASMTAQHGKAVSGAAPKNAKASAPKNKNAKSGNKPAAAVHANAGAKAPAGAGFGNLNVRFIMQPRFLVDGRGLASTWQANLHVTGHINDPHVSGNINCVRGNLDFLGKIFHLSRGIVFFGGGSLANPLVDVDLSNDTPDLTAHILVTGPANKIRLQLTSDPSLPRDEILSRVLFGRSINDLSRSEALQLAGAVAQLAGFGGGGGILSSAKKALGVDVLRIGTSDVGGKGDSDDDGTNLEMGKYLNDYIYAGVQQGFTPDSTAFIIEVEITPRANLEVRTERNNTWGGLKWKMNY